MPTKSRAGNGLSLGRRLLAVAAWGAVLAAGLEAGLPLATARAQAPGPATPPAAVVEETDPAILALRGSNPTSAEQLVHAMQVTLGLGRLDEMRRYADRLDPAAVTPDELLQLHRRFGSGFFLKLDDEKRFGAKTAAFSRSVMKAAADARRSEARLNELIGVLATGTQVERAAAGVALREAGVAAIPPLIRALGDPAQAAAHPRIRLTLGLLRSEAVWPLIAALDSGNEALAARAAATLADLETRQATPFLVRPFLDASLGVEYRRAAGRALQALVGVAPTREDAAIYLNKRFEAYMNGALPRRPDENDQIVLWQWDATAKTVAPQRYSRAAASFLIAAQLLRDLAALEPDNDRYRRMELVARLQAIKLQVGRATPLDRKSKLWTAALALGADDLEAVLQEALALKLHAAAIGTLELLGATGDVSLVQSKTGVVERPVAAALRHPSPHVRFAAAQAILQLDPHTRYAGSSRLLETLCFFVRSAGRQRALVAHPRRAEAQSIVGLLVSMGYSAESATTGRELLRLAHRNPDIRFVLISSWLDGPSAWQTVQRLRENRRTAQLPVGLYTRAPEFERIKVQAKNDPLVVVMPRPHSIRGLSTYSHQLHTLSEKRTVSDVTRLQFARIAIQALRKMVESPHDYDFYNLRSITEDLLTAIRNPLVAEDAAMALGALGDSQSQTALADVASDNNLPLSLRKTAAAAFKKAVEAHGVGLTIDQIRKQYQRYNKSKVLDRETQKVLASLLDTIEAPSKRAAEKKGGAAGAAKAPAS